MSYTNRVSINKKSPVPIYYQVATNLRERIINGEWKVDEKIPSEAQLTEEYNISRVALRQALNELLKEDIITKIKGKGAFIKTNPKPITHDLSLPHVLSSKLEKVGQTLNPLVLEFTLRDPIPNINKQLNLSETEKLIYIKRLFILANKPIGINRAWIAESKVPGILDEPLIENHLSKTLQERYNLLPVEVENSLQSTIPDAEDLRLLNKQYNVAVTLLKAISYISEEEPLEYSETIWLGDSVNFTYKTTAKNANY